MAFIPSSNSVVAFQSNPSVLQTLAGLMSTNASVITVGTAVANQSVSGTIGASVIGLTPVAVSNFPAVQVVAPNNSSLFALQPAGSILAVSGTFTPAANQSVSGTVQADIRGSVAAVIIGGSIATTTGNSSVQVLNFPANQSVSGTVGTTQSGTWISSIVNTVPSSVIVGASIFGQLPAGTAMLGSIVAYQGAIWNIAGSVVAGQVGTRISSIAGNVTVVSSIAGGIFPVSGSVATVMTAWQNPSIVGTYIEDAAHTSGDRGLFVMGVRNDTMSSVTSADIEYGPITIGVAGEIITAPGATFTKWVSGQTSIMYGASVAVIAAQGSSVFTYITAIQVVNDSANYSRLTFQGASGSTLGFTAAPGSGGSNIVLPNAWKTNANGAFTASISGISSVYVSASGFISKT